MKMKTVEEIVESVKKLPPAEICRLADELKRLNLADLWDARIEEDLRAGRLDHLADEAVAEFRAGKTRPFSK